MMDQLLHVLHEHVIVVVASTVVEYYLLQTLRRGFEGLFDLFEPIATLTGVTAFIVTLEIVWLSHFDCFQPVT